MDVAKERAEELASSRPYLSTLSRAMGHNPILMWDVASSEVIGHCASAGFDPPLTTTALSFVSADHAV